MHRTNNINTIMHAVHLQISFFNFFLMMDLLNLLIIHINKDGYFCH